VECAVVVIDQIEILNLLKAKNKINSESDYLGPLELLYITRRIKWNSKLRDNIIVGTVLYRYNTKFKQIFTMPNTYHVKPADFNTNTNSLLYILYYILIL
jgi:hypothetical protein